MKWFGAVQIVKLLHNPPSRSFLSFLIGLGLIVLILHRPTFTEKTLSMSVADVESKIVRHGDSCYKFRAEDVECEKVSTKE